jgi:hypothetical protein
VLSTIPEPVSECTDQRIPPRVDRAIARALAKDPDDRHPSCIDFARALVHGACTAFNVSGTRRRAGLRSPAPVAAPSDAGAENRDEARALMRHAEDARHALARNDLTEAAGIAALCVELTEGSKDPEVARIANMTAATFEMVLIERLGGLENTLRVARAAEPGDALTPSRVFLLSRIDGLTLLQALDLSVASRGSTLASLVILADLGLVTTDANASTACS